MYLSNPQILALSGTLLIISAALAVAGLCAFWDSRINQKRIDAIWHAFERDHADRDVVIRHASNPRRWN